MNEAPAGDVPYPRWDHPHASYHYGVALYLRACAQGQDASDLIFALAAMVRKCDAEGRFEAAWRDLQREADERGVTRTGVAISRKMRMDELRAREFALIEEHAERLKFYAPPDAAYSEADLERALRRLNRRGGG
jgi:hypothetical protein